MNKLTALLLSATLSLASGAALAADTANNGSNENNGSANAAASAGVGTPEAQQNQAPNNVDNKDINTGNMNNAGTTGTNTNTGAGTGTSSGTMLNPGTTSTDSATSSGPQSADEIHKNTQCKDGKCPDVNDKVETNQGNDKVNPNTDGTTH